MSSRSRVDVSPGRSESNRRAKGTDLVRTRSPSTASRSAPGPTTSRPRSQVVVPRRGGDDRRSRTHRGEEEGQPGPGRDSCKRGGSESSSDEEDRRAFQDELRRATWTYYSKGEGEALSRTGRPLSRYPLASSNAAAFRRLLVEVEGLGWLCPMPGCRTPPPK